MVLKIISSCDIYSSPCERREPGRAVESLKSLGCSGWNVTVPHKSAIIQHLDEIDAFAKQMNAVNTVEVLANGSLRGSNTDGQGFVRSLEELLWRAV